MVFCLYWDGSQPKAGRGVAGSRGQIKTGVTRVAEAKGDFATPGTFSEINAGALGGQLNYLPVRPVNISATWPITGVPRGSS